MNEAGFGGRSVGVVLEEVAAKRPAPGGGAVAALAGSLASALGRMVVAYSGEIGAEVGERLESVQSRLLRLADEDAGAYSELSRLLKLGPGDPERAGLGEASRLAAGVPLEIVERCGEVLGVCEEMGSGANRWLRSDLAIAAILAESAGRSAAWMVRVNLPGVAEHLGDRVAEEMRAACEGALEGMAGRLGRVLEMCGGSSG